MSISVIIPNYNGDSLLREYLPSVSHPVTVVDDASTDGSVEMLRREFPEVKIVERRTNGGFSAAVNDGISATDSEFVVLLNSDVEVTAGFLDNIMPLFADEDVFAVSPKVLLPKRDNLDEACKTGFWHRGMFYVDQKQEVQGVTPILYTTGCAAVYRRSMLTQLGGFDMAYSPFYWEDADLGYRAWKRGWKSLYQPASTVYHQHSASTSLIDRSFTDRIKARNGFFFIWRNIEDRGLIREHRYWLPLVLARRIVAGDSAFVSGWSEAFRRRREAIAARERDSLHRKLSDREIFGGVGIRLP